MIHVTLDLLDTFILTTFWLNMYITYNYIKHKTWQD